MLNLIKFNKYQEKRRVGHTIYNEAKMQQQPAKFYNNSYMHYIYGLISYTPFDLYIISNISFQFQTFQMHFQINNKRVKRQIGVV